MDQRVANVVLIATMGALAVVGWRLRISDSDTPKWRRWIFCTTCGLVVGVGSQLVFVGFTTPLLLACLTIGMLAGALAGLILNLVPGYTTPSE